MLGEPAPKILTEDSLEPGRAVVEALLTDDDRENATVDESESGGARYEFTGVEFAPEDSSVAREPSGLSRG